MPERSPMLAVGDTVSAKIPKGEAGFVVVGIAYQAGAVGFSGALEASVDDGTTWATPVKMHDPVVGELGAEITALTTTGQLGWIRNPGYTDVRLRCTAFTTPGNGVAARINVRDA